MAERWIRVKGTKSDRDVRERNVRLWQGASNMLFHGATPAAPLSKCADVEVGVAGPGAEVRPRRGERRRLLPLLPADADADESEERCIAARACPGGGDCGDDDVDEADAGAEDDDVDEADAGAEDDDEGRRIPPPEKGKAWRASEGWGRNSSSEQIYIVWRCGRPLMGCKPGAVRGGSALRLDGGATRPAPAPAPAPAAVGTCDAWPGPSHARAPTLVRAASPSVGISGVASAAMKASPSAASAASPASTSISIGAPAPPGLDGARGTDRDAWSASVRSLDDLPASVPPPRVGTTFPPAWRLLVGVTVGEMLSPTEGGGGEGTRTSRGAARGAATPACAPAAWSAATGVVAALCVAVAVSRSGDMRRTAVPTTGMGQRAHGLPVRVGEGSAATDRWAEMGWEATYRLP